MSQSQDPKSYVPNQRREISDAELDQVRQSLQGLLFGSVSIVIQDGVIVQIDRTEKRRLRTSNINHSPSSKR